MSITTKRGDDGTTALMYNRRVSKGHPRVEAYAQVDELNASLGLARATCGLSDASDFLKETQKELVVLMGELATAPEDLERYIRDGYGRIEEKHVHRLEEKIRDLESGEVNFNGWATPGNTLHAGYLDQARVVCRSAERRIVVLRETAQGPAEYPHLIVYLNRLSDLLWLMARDEETRAETRPSKA